jgi:hypothetical protein
MTDNIQNTDLNSLDTSSPSDTTAAAEISGQQSTDWKSSLSEDLRSDKSLESIKSIEDLAKSHISAQRMLGGRIPIPSEDASKEVKEEFYSKLGKIPNVVKLPDPNDPNASKEYDKLYERLGRPSSPDKYSIEVPDELKNMQEDKEFLKAAKETAYKVGLNQTQLKALADLQNQKSLQMLEAMKVQKKNTIEFLNKEWGNAFEENKNNYKDTMRKYQERFPDAVSELENGYAGNNPVVVMMAAELGRLYRENGTISPNSSISGSITPEAAKSQIADIMANKSHPYHDYNSPAHSDAVAKVQHLFKDAYPATGPKSNY